MAKSNPTKISELIPDDKNFNTGSEYGNQLIEKSFRKFGAGRSILLDKNNRIIAGNKSVENFAAIGMEDVQIVESDGKRLIAVKRTDIDLDTPEGRELALADNATAKANIVFDAELIEAEVGEAVAEEWGIELKKDIHEDDFEAEPPLNPITVLGDVYEMNQHRVGCLNSTLKEDIEKIMLGKKADMIFTDPPYNVDYEGGLSADGNGGLKSNKRTKLINDNTDIYPLVVPLMAEFCNGAIYTWFADTKAKTVYSAIESCGDIHALIIWVKNGGYGALNANYKQKHEPCLYWKAKGKKLNFVGDTTETTVWNIDKDGQNKFHPTQKPISLAAKAIGNHSAGLILDMFGGSGSTLMACDQLNRLAYVIELDPAYCDIIVARYIKYKRSQSSGTEITIKRNGKPLSEEDLQKYVAQIEPNAKA